MIQETIVKNQFTPTLTKHGKPGWRLPDGRVIPVVAGASDAPPAEPQVQPPAEPVATPEPPAPAQEPGITIPVSSVPPQDQTPMDPDRVFTAADIERARKEEKDKLYPRLSQMEEELNRIRQEREAREAAEAQARREAEEAARREAEEAMSVRELLQQKEQEWSEKIAAAEAKAEEAARIFEMEQQLQALERYTAQRLTEEEEHIMPELRDLVGGTTQEEIEQSIAFAKERTARIVGSVAAATQQQRQTQRGTSVTAPPVGPLENDSNYKTLSTADIAAMDINEYKQHRDQLLAAARDLHRRGG